MQLKTGIRVAARAVLPNRDWAPIEAWDDERYGRYLDRVKAQPDDLEAQRQASKGVNGPLFSIIVPLYKTPASYLRDMAESVLAQTYPRFELVLVNASPESDELCALTAEFVERDSRVCVVELEGNLGITENTNRGVDVARGDFVCFMDHDDWIEPDTLFEYAAALHEHEDIDLFYCDEDMVEKRGDSWTYCHPMFKPDYSPEFLLCRNYVMHFLAVRKSVIEKLPRPGKEYDGAQDYNLTFRVAERARRVHHVARVLYHWRISDTSTAMDAGAKPYARRASVLSVKGHLDRLGAIASVVDSGVPYIHNIWFRPDEVAKVSVIAIASDGADCGSLARMLESFTQVNSYRNVELVAVVAHSEQDADALSAVGARRVTAHANDTMLERFNAGAREASGDVLLFLDSNCEFATPEPIEQIVGMIGLSGVGIVAPKVLYADYRVKYFGIGVSQRGVVPLYRGFPLGHYSYLCNLRAFQNASAAGYQGLAISKELFSGLGGFDANYSTEMGSVALCARASEQGERIALTCTVMVLTSELPPQRVFDMRGNHADFPVDEVDRFRRSLATPCNANDMYRNPHLDQASSYPEININLHA